MGLINLYASPVVRSDLLTYFLMEKFPKCHPFLKQWGWGRYCYIFGHKRLIHKCVQGSIDGFVDKEARSVAKDVNNEWLHCVLI